LPNNGFTLTNQNASYDYVNDFTVKVYTTCKCKSTKIKV